MPRIIFYTTHCPQCAVLETKLKQGGWDYETVTDVDEMKRIGLTSAPALSVDGELMLFPQAFRYLSTGED